MNVISLLRSFIVNSCHILRSFHLARLLDIIALGERHSSEMPFALIVFAHFSISAAMNVPR
jgi:hypothetical protein